MKPHIPLLVTLITQSICAQVNMTYQIPPDAILQLADYTLPPRLSMDSRKEFVLLSWRDTYKTLEDLNQEEMKLAGLRINPLTHISSTVTYIRDLKIRRISETVERTIAGLPENPRIAHIRWSPDEHSIGFTHTGEGGLELWVIDVAGASARRLYAGPLNANLGTPFTWSADSNRLLVKILPAHRSPLINHAKAIPQGPVISTSDGVVSQNRTYADLLNNRIDELNFENLVTSELLTIDREGGVQPFLPAAMYETMDFSPDGNYVLVTSIQKPFSYVVPYRRFPLLVEVFSSVGEKVREINRGPLVENMPKGFMATRTGKRNVFWRPDVPASLCYVEALDGGDPACEVPHRDALFTWDAPFTLEPREFFRTPQRLAQILWHSDQCAIVSDYWYDTRNWKTYLIRPDCPSEAPRILADRNYQDIYSDPGDFQTEKNAWNEDVLAVRDDCVFLVGSGFSPAGKFPFIDRLNLKDLNKSRLYQATRTDQLEDILSIEDFDKGIAMVRIESKTEYPNYAFRNFFEKDALTPVTAFPNPFAAMNSVHKEVLKYKRSDGVDLSGLLYLPPGFDRNSGEKLPLLIWAYPREFKDKNSAGQSTSNPNEFTYPYYGSFVYWALRGYAVLDDATFPIVGEGTSEPNDSFIEQLIDNARSAIDAVDALGCIDRKRVGIGGHSYGAFMVANLLSHSDLFACGIARSGAYNRTLTPFGFQGEQRNFWDAPDTYNRMSPFMSAHRMKTPMLLTHGEADNNPGTFTLQTERYFQALKGLGAPVRMILLPKESHSYVARENILHLLWEQDRFFEEYLQKSR